MLNSDCYQKMIELINQCLQQNLETLAIKIEMGKIIITKKDFIDKWYENIHVAIWEDKNKPGNFKVSIDAGYKYYSQDVNKGIVDKNREYLEQKKELFTQAGFSFDPTGAPYSGFIVYRFSNLSNIFEILLAILKILYFLIKLLRLEKSNKPIHPTYHPAGG